MTRRGRGDAPYVADWRALPDEILVHVCRFGQAPCLTTIVCVCQTWAGAAARDAESLWQQFALARFPRLRAIVAASTGATPSYRLLYQRQLQAEKHKRCEDLRDVLFTVEIDVDDQHLMRWTGRADRVADHYILLSPWAISEVAQRKSLLEAMRFHSFYLQPEGHVVECRIFATRDFRTVLTYVGMLEDIGDDVLYFEERPTESLPESAKRPQLWPAVDLPDPNDEAGVSEPCTMRIHVVDDDENELLFDDIVLYVHTLFS